ncbi:recombinase family protein [Paenibacillus sp. P96]|uniref:Recombinase family protein n=1 Tax=Paenibacillus zeirhizosphaerae TaxID=2987519 RepID=A0ABT9FXC6_9BACL|nr:recombinase family protein [Paenibacillus sp. P96]MDP4099377.1 recombinase family protein [Paenibacillus sp. P96]
MGGTEILGALYLRISRDKGEDEDTLQNHRESMLEYGRQNGYRYEIYEEIVSGGKHNLDARPQLQKLIANIERYRAILVVSLDRLSRNGMISQQIKQLCMDHDIKIITPYQTFDLCNSQEDRLLYDVSSMFAVMEYEMIGSRNKLNKIQRARRGEYMAGKPAYGYRRNPDSKRLEIYEPEAEVVRYMFKLHREGKSSRRIAEQLNEEGYRPQSAASFQPSTIKRMLQNPVYKGSVVFRDRKRLKEDGHYTWKVLETIIAESAHPAIIPPDQWEQVNQEDMEHPSTEIREKPARKTGTTMLKDLLFCGICGRKLAMRKERNGGYVIKPCQYVMPDRQQKCNNQGMKLGYMEAEILRRLQVHKQQLQQELEHLVEHEFQDIWSELQEHLAHVEQELELNQRHQLILADPAWTEIFSHEELVKKRQALLRQQELLQQTRTELQQRNQNTMVISRREQLYYIIDMLDRFSHRTVEEQNDTLKQFIRRIHYTRVMPEEIRAKPMRSKEREQYPFEYTIEYI